MAGVLAVLLSLCSCQEREGQPPPPATAGWSFDLGVHGRVSLPISSMESNINMLHQNPAPLLGRHGWGDFYPTGFGGAIQAELMWEQRATEPDGVDPESAWAVGGYVSIAFDNYLGEQRTDPFGSFIEPADLTVFSLLMGPKLSKGLGGGFFVDGHLGFGPAHFATVRADMVNGPQTQSMRGEFIRGSWVFGAELGAHAGYRTKSIAFSLGVDVRVLTSPESGSAVELSSEILIEVAFDLGIDLRF